MVDNASTDGSPVRLREWAEGSRPVAPHHALRELVVPAADKPVVAKEPVNHLRRGLDLADRGDLRGAIAELERMRRAGRSRSDGVSAESMITQL